MADHEGRAYRFKDWQYMTEGGCHVIFCRGSNQCPHEESSQKQHAQGHRSLLRCRKDDLVSLVVQNGSIQSYVQNTEMTPASQIRKRSFSFVRDIVCPCLGQFVDVPQVEYLDRSMAQQLYRQAMKSGKIPQHRQKCWQLPERNEPKYTKSTAEAIEATLMPDYRYPFLPTSPSQEATQSCWAFEFKPKAGYGAFSPFVDPRHRVKYSDCRFRLLQQFKNTCSTYNPLDFFSSDLQRIRRSLHDLMQCPQNNLRVWKYDALRGLSTVDLEKLIDPSKASNEAFDVRNAVDVVSKILHREDFLSRLLSLQELDWIDADGAILLYHMLQSKIPTKSASEIHALIDSICLERNEDLVDTVHCTLVDNQLVTKMIDNNPIPLPKSTGAALIDLIKYIADFRELQTSRKGLSSSELDQAHTDCVRLAKVLNADEIVYLLQTWLLSLAMCDVSFFVTLQIVSSTSHHSSHLQEQENPGFIVHDETTPFSYRIKLVDCDAKPSSKLAVRHKKEALFSID